MYRLAYRIPRAGGQVNTKPRESQMTSTMTVPGELRPASLAGDFAAAAVCPGGQHSHTVPVADG